MALFRSRPDAGFWEQLDPGLLHASGIKKLRHTMPSFRPGRSFDIRVLSEDELKGYQLIRQHYLAQFRPCRNLISPMQH